jgi:hypothetical protein
MPRGGFPGRAALYGVCLFLVVACAASGGANSWTTNGPFGGSVSSIAIDPKNPLTIYAGARGVFKSVDAGMTWRAAGLGKSFVTILQIDPSNPQTLYAGFFDGGLVHWQPGVHGLPALSSVRALVDSASQPHYGVDV